MPSQDTLIHSANSTNIIWDRGLLPIEQITTVFPLIYTFPYNSIKFSCYSIETHIKISWLAQPETGLAASLDVSNDGLFNITPSSNLISPVVVWTRIIDPHTYKFFVLPVLGEYGTMKIEACDGNGNLLGQIPPHSYYYTKTLLTYSSDNVNPDGLVC